MSVFNLKDGLNRINNPSTNGVFRYGYWNNTLSTFTTFDAYGYTDGTPFVSEPFDNTKILGWYKTSNVNPHVSVAFENLNGNVNVTPQPFPAFGVYLHPGGIGTSNIQNPGIRITVPNNGQISLVGTIQAATTDGCGSNVGYRVMKNMITALIPRTNLPKSNTATNINIPASSLIAGDIVDIIIDYGDDLTDYCDDTTLDVTLTVVLDKIATPIRLGSPDCENTVLTYLVPLQQVGTATLYRNGVTVTSVPLTISGSDGLANFTGLNLTVGGTYYVIVTHVGQDTSNQSVNYVIEECDDDTCNSVTPYHINCQGKTIQSITVVKEGDTDNRYIGRTSSVIMFQSDIGTFDYIITIVDNDNFTHTFKLIDFQCEV